MLSRDEKVRLKTLITDTVVLLCKNGLVPKLQGEFCIEGLIGISLEQDDLMLVSINEKLCGSKRNEHLEQSSFSETDDDQVNSVSYRRKKCKRKNKKSIEAAEEASPTKKRAIIDIHAENSPHPRLSTDSPALTDSSVHLHHNQPAIIQPPSSHIPSTSEYQPSVNVSETSALGGGTIGMVRSCSDYLMADNSCTGDSFSQTSIKLEHYNTDSDDDLVVIKEEVKTQPVIDTANSSFSLQPQIQHIIPNQSTDSSLIAPQQTIVSLPVTGPVVTDNTQEVAPNLHKTDIPYKDVQFYRSTRNYIKVELYGYTYNLDRQGTSGAEFWRCDKRTIHCKGRLKITPEKCVFLIRQHNHQPECRKTKLHMQVQRKWMSKDSVFKVCLASVNEEQYKLEKKRAAVRERVRQHRERKKNKDDYQKKQDTKKDAQLHMQVQRKEIAKGSVFPVCLAAVDEAQYKLERRRAAARERARRYRQRMKLNAVYQEKQKKRKQIYRIKLKGKDHWEKCKQEASRVRAKLIKKLKEEQIDPTEQKEGTDLLSENDLKSQRDYWKLAKRRSRANLSEEKREIIRKRERERKRKQRNTTPSEEKKETIRNKEREKKRKQRNTILVASDIKKEPSDEL